VESDQVVILVNSYFTYDYYNNIYHYYYFCSSLFVQTVTLMQKV